MTGIASPSIDLSTGRSGLLPSIPSRLTLLLLGLLSTAPAVRAQPGLQVIDLTVERMLELGLRDSYQVRRLVLEVERTRSLLQAEQAGLKSRVELEVLAPEFEAITDYKWNSTLQRNELIHENTRRSQANLSVRQPVILFGYPTNGYLSLNTRIYRYSQLGEERDVRYYHRYFVAYDQPLFQPNEMRHDLEEARLDLEEAELDYQDEVIEMLDDLSDEYYGLVEAAYERQIAESRVTDIEDATAAARALAASDPGRTIELDQLQVELANAREQVQQAASSYRLQAESIKQSLRLALSDSILVRPHLEVHPVNVDPAQALEYARTLSPNLRNLAIQLRGSEIDLAQTKGRDSFRIDLELTYGRETQDERFNQLWTEPKDSYTLNVEATLPIWDWGERRYRIRASEHSLQRTNVQIEETESRIESNVRNVIVNLEEYEQRALNMQENLTLAERITTSYLDRYRAGEITLVNLLQTINRESDTAANFLEAYLDYQQQLLRLRELTHFDFEYGLPVSERFPVTTGG